MDEHPDISDDEAIAGESGTVRISEDERPAPALSPNAPDAPEPRAPSPASGRRPSLVPPDGKPPVWWVKHRRALAIAEWVLAAMLLLTALYYLALLFWPAQTVGVAAPEQPPPTREEFRALMRGEPAVAADPSWKVATKNGRWRSIVVHHTATDGGSAASIDRFHREVRKWKNGLGYHFVIGNGKGMADGEIAVGERWKKQLDGAHVKGKDNANSYSIGIALVGNFDKTMPTAKQLAALRGLVDFLRKEYTISISAVIGHNAAAASHTACPGRWFFMDELLLALANP